MRRFLGTIVLALFVTTGAMAGGGYSNDGPEQYVMPQTKVVVVPPAPENDNTVIWGSLIAAAGAIGAAAIGLRSRRKGE